MAGTAQGSAHGSQAGSAAADARFPGPAAYASKPWESRGRLHPEDESPTRSAFQRDRDRILHAAAFRRLKYKTQVFVLHEGDNFRTRLTHSLEVAQIARSVCRCLGLDEDLAEAVALAHDLGHTPFGHAGGDALDQAMATFGGFDHNDQSIRVVTALEQRYAEFDGLNLTWETLEGIAKHNGPLAGPHAHAKAARGPSPSIAAYSARNDLDLASFAGPEAQVAALADDIAYNAHDLDDAWRAGFFKADDIADVPLVGPILRGVRARYPAIETSRLVHEVNRRVITAMVEDLLAQTRERLRALAPRSAAEVRAAAAPVAAFSDAMRDNDLALKRFLFERVYRHYRVNRMTAKGRRVVSELFAYFMAAPECLPDDWRGRATADEPVRARAVADYIAGMTDRFALDEHDRVFDLHVRH
ncbi:MAG: deoxyguanosinetriphosphate triphosphohydrolase [Alphaproteobacteria bacterium]|nr:deoxyguanosinetriphosphate triphosphohydrolase [Alphaproteobacteria bacterium]